MESTDINMDIALPSIDDPLNLVEDNDCVEVKVEKQETKKIKGKWKREKKFTLPIWAVFELLHEDTTDDIKRVKCKFCGEVKKYYNQYGTGGMEGPKELSDPDRISAVSS
ncbi:hypothetical protein DITRI_Ditri18aG0044200 [Diplodiscus trichospermus]